MTTAAISDVRNWAYNAARWAKVLAAHNEAMAQRTLTAPDPTAEARER